MRERTPEWLTQIRRGLRDGKNWFVQELRSLPPLVRLGGWAVFQAVLFKIQPQLWHGLTTIARFVGGLTTLHVRTRLLSIVLLFLAGQTALVVSKLNKLRMIVKNMEGSIREETGPVTDGGSRTELVREEESGPSGVGAVCGAVAGGALGIAWGPAGVIGLAILGAMVGDEWEQRVLEV
ncbi:hypothetical protein NGM10_05260 [Halorussus salilacus]|uniref:hypothetical protein n=1 Tax=Halorussus salilacus TaxID=2953750 RepID=UPI00209DCA7D|nr:hypothetical protein [Halorussus salilacus]USZ69147.1 hypothetical protein NGM10_05260 [Halorussus salilacus]